MGAKLGGLSFSRTWHSKSCILLGSPTPSTGAEPASALCMLLMPVGIIRYGDFLTFGSTKGIDQARPCSAVQHELSSGEAPGFCLPPSIGMARQQERWKPCISVVAPHSMAAVIII
jgi:hypothetical protein